MRDSALHAAEIVLANSKSTAMRIASAVSFLPMLHCGFVELLFSEIVLLVAERLLVTAEDVRIANELSSKKALKNNVCKGTQEPLLSFFCDVFQS